MKSQRTITLIRGLILICFGLMIIYLVLTGKIELYISPKLTWLSKLSVVLLIAIAIAKIIPEKHNIHSQCNHVHACGCEHHDHDNKRISITQIVIFMIPIILGFAMQPRVLTSTALANSINTAGPVPFYVNNLASSNLLSSIFKEASSLGKKSVSPVSKNSADSNSANKPIPTTTVDFNQPNPQVDKTLAKETDLVQLDFNLDDHPEQVYGQKWRLTGFVYKDPKLTKNQFVISRFAVTCCIADATPVGIIAESYDAPNLKSDTWLEVEGVLQQRTVNGADKIQPLSNFHSGNNTVPYLVVTSWKITKTPKDPYLVPPR